MMIRRARGYKAVSRRRRPSCVSLRGRRGTAGRAGSVQLASSSSLCSMQRRAGETARVIKRNSEDGSAHEGFAGEAQRRGATARRLHCTEAPTTRGRTRCLRDVKS